MIKTFKKTIKNLYYWTKKKLIRFKKWIILIIFGSVILAASLPTEIPPEYVTAPENNTYKIGIKNFQEEFKENIIDDRPLQYKLDEKFISFKPVEMKWDNAVLKTALSSIKNDKKYDNIFGRGIHLEMETGERVWSKIISIDRLNILGKIPTGTEYLEIEYEVDTNFIIDGWNKKDIFEITETTRLGDYSYIEPAYIWDSYSEEICEIIEEEEFCDTIINKIQIKSYFKSKDDKLIYTKQIPVEWLKNAQYPIQTDADIIYGVAQEFEDGTDGHTANSVRIAELDTNKFVVCWHDGTGYDGLCKVGTVSETTITWGATSKAADMGSISGASALDVCKLDTDKFVVTTGAPLTGFYAQAVTVSTRTIGTWGTQVTLSTNDIRYPRAAQLNTDKFIVCFNDATDSDTGKCIANTVSTTTITVGTEEEIDGNGGATKDYYPRYGDIAQLNTDKFIFCFEEEETGDDGYCVVGTTSGGTDITWGANTIYTIDNPQMIGIASPDTDKFVLSFRNATDSKGETIAGTVSTRTITYGGTIIHENGGDAENNSVTEIDSTHVVTVYADVVDGGKGKGNYSTIDWADSSVSISTEDEFEAGDTGGGYYDAGLDVYKISADKVIICYQDDADLDKGKCIVGDTPSEAPPEARRMFLTQ